MSTTHEGNLPIDGKLADGSTRACAHANPVTGEVSGDVANGTREGLDAAAAAVPRDFDSIRGTADRELRGASEGDSAIRTIGILGAGQAGSALATAFVGLGYGVLIANSREPATLQTMVEGLGPGARAAWAKDAAAGSDIAIVAFPYTPHDQLPVAELAGKIVLDTNNYMPWRDGQYSEVDSGRATVHELRQRMLPDSKVVKAFTHIQFHPRLEVRGAADHLPAILRLARPRGASDRIALALSSDYPDAVEIVSRIYDELGFDAVDNSPLAESWRSAPGTPMWLKSVDGQSTQELVRNLAMARR